MSLLPPFPEPPEATPEACAASFACPRIRATKMPGSTCVSRYFEVLPHSATHPRLGPCYGCPAGELRLLVLGVPRSMVRTAPGRRRPNAGRPLTPGRSTPSVAAVLAPSAPPATTATAPSAPSPAPAPRPAPARPVNDCNGQESPMPSKKTAPADARAAQPARRPELLTVSELLEREAAPAGAPTTHEDDCPRCDRPKAGSYRDGKPPKDERAEFCGKCLDAARTTLGKLKQSRTPAAIVEYLRKTPSAVAARARLQREQAAPAAAAAPAPIAAPPPALDVTPTPAAQADPERPAAAPTPIWIPLQADPTPAAPPAPDPATAPDPRDPAVINAIRAARDLPETLDVLARLDVDIAALDRRRASLAAQRERICECLRDLTGVVLAAVRPEASP